MYTLRSEGVEVEILPEFGGRIHRLRYHGWDILRSPIDPMVHESEPLWWGSYPMLPWCNRVPGGILRFDGRQYQLPVREGDAIHGRTYDRQWVVVGDGEMEYRDPGDSSFPFRYSAWQRITLSEDALHISIGLRNEGENFMPAGCGIHPWFDASSPLEVRLPAETVYQSTDHIPYGAPIPVDGSTDLRQSREPALGIDETWTDLTESCIELAWPQRQIRARFSFSSNADHVVLAAVGDLAAVAIEPQTHVTDGHRRRQDGERGGIGRLGPSETMGIEYELAFGTDQTRPDASTALL
jgi:aldose 1-epimerase